VSEASPGNSGKFLAFAAIAEAGVGLAMTIDPARVVTLLLGVDLSGAGTLLGRFFGIALLALELACWPGRPRGNNGSRIFEGLLFYNVLFALYLAYLGTLGRLWGWLLWPAVAFHAVVALVLVSAWRGERRTKAIAK
jgi:hypothetical protein